MVKLLLHYLYNLEYPDLRMDASSPYGFTVNSYEGKMSVEWGHADIMTPATSDAGGCDWPCKVSEQCASSESC